MDFTRSTVARIDMPYPLGTLTLDGERCVVASTEDHGPILLSRPPYQEAHPVVEGPGGSMALVEDPDRPGELFAIMGCFLGYRFQTGAVYHLLRDGPRAGDPWRATRILELPFAHRIAPVRRGGARWLLAASLAADKRDPADWSQPGTLVASRMPKKPGDPWEFAPVLSGIHRHHGMRAGRFMGRPCILVSGTEGLFAADLSTDGTRWDFERVMESEVSEIAVLDIDGDGVEELVTIEPFHGNTLRIYRRDASRWSRIWETGLEFGHCLWAGSFGGAPGILASNRAGNRDLLLFQWKGHAPADRGLPDPERTVVDAGVGAANMLVLEHGGGELIFSTNQVTGEIACYRPAG